MTKIQETGDKVLANVERVIVGKHHERPAGAGRAVVPGAPARSRTCPGTGKTIWPRPSPAASAAVQAHPVHAGPAAVGRPACRSTTRRARSSSSGPGPIITRSCWPTRSTGRRRRPSRPCWRRWRSARRRSTASPTRCRARSWCRDPEPHRVRGHVPPARGPARPLHAAPPPGLPPAHRGDRHPRRAEAHHPLEEHRGGPTARSCAACRRPSARCTSTRRSPTTSSASSTPRATHPDVYLGASPRGSLALYRAGQALAGLLGATTSSPTTSSRSPSPRSPTA